MIFTTYNAFSTSDGVAVGASIRRGAAVAPFNCTPGSYGYLVDPIFDRIWPQPLLYRRSQRSCVLSPPYNCFSSRKVATTQSANLHAGWRLASLGGESLWDGDREAGEDMRGRSGEFGDELC